MAAKKSEPTRVIGSQDELDPEANSATNGNVVEPAPLENPSHIAPPQQIVSPPENPAPTLPSEDDPIQP